MDYEAEFRTWNVFHRRRDDGLCCAVSAETPVPPFLLSGDWSFGFAFACGDPPMPGFCPDAAETGAGPGGFYLFMVFTAPGGRHPERRAALNVTPPGAERLVCALLPGGAPSRRREQQEDRCPSTPIV